MRSTLTGTLLCAASLALSQTVRLQPKFPNGRTDRVTAVTHMVQSFSTPGAAKPMQMVMDQTMAVIMKVVSSNSQGATLKMTYESLSTTMTMNGSKMDQGSDMGKLVKGKSVNLFFTPDAKLKKVTGFSELMGSTNAPAQTKAMMKQLLSEDSIRQMWAMSFGGVFPNRPVRVGETWTSAATIGQSPMKLSLKLKMRLTKVSANVALISIGGTGAMDMSGLEGMNMTMKTKKLEVSGTASFDTARGWLKEQNLVMTMSGTMVTTAQGKRQETPFASKISTTTKAKPVS